MMRLQLPSYLALPEGPWKLQHEKRTSNAFSPESRVSLTLAQLGQAAGDLAGSYLVASILHMLCIYPLPSPDRVGAPAAGWAAGRARELLAQRGPALGAAAGGLPAACPGQDSA